MHPDDLEGLSPQGWMKRLHVGRLFIFLSKAPFVFTRVGVRITLRSIWWRNYELGWHWLPAVK